MGVGVGGAPFHSCPLETSKTKQCRPHLEENCFILSPLSGFRRNQLTQERVEVSAHTPGWGVPGRASGRGEADEVKEDGNGRSVTSNIWSRIGVQQGKAFRRRRCVQEAFKDCNCNKQGLPRPSQMSREEVEGGGRREEEERGRKRSGLQSPERGDRQMLADGCEG